jgi:hypothetical protein
MLQRPGITVSGRVLDWPVAYEKRDDETRPARPIPIRRRIR